MKERNVIGIKLSGLFSALLSVVFLLAVVDSAEAGAADKWRLYFNGKAKNDGVVVVAVMPAGGQLVNVDLPIADHTGENDAARDAVVILREKLGADNYNIERDDGEEVRIGAKHGRADFELEVVSNSVKGLSVKARKE